ncbi:hypothetical protein [Streptomyces sp. SA15]|uniref:hypothetical protein n=1 Tax=Streptomyces sp. SA15 TaxID=934019 RepID=UPI00211D0904|nr:hypothetical protein [Streptomyces sp. SA15]
MIARAGAGPLRHLVVVWRAESAWPEGARFETYAYADRLLGLELARDVGASA